MGAAIVCDGYANAIDESNPLPVAQALRGKATGGTTTTVVDAKRDFLTDVFKDKLIRITIGGVEYWRMITASAGNTLTFAAIVSDTGASATVKAASAETDKLTVALAAGTAAAGNALNLLLTTAEDDTLAVTKVDATKTIVVALAKTTAAKNTAELIEAAIQALDTVGGVSVAEATCTAAGNWDTAAKATGDAAAVAFSGGLDAVSVTPGTVYEVLL
jgi:hypothetical protein